MRLVLLLLCLFFVGCATKGTTVVLVEDPDGSVGQVEVSTPSGTQRLAAAGQATSVKNSSARPDPVHSLDQTAIEKDYGPAMRAMPTPPERFLLYFEFGRAELTLESQPAPAKILESVQLRNSRDVRVNGHSDTVGSQEDNARLSLDRAQEARSLLIEQGVDPSIIQVSSHGEGNPLIPTPDETPEPRNRRVEVLVR